MSIFSLVLIGIAAMLTLALGIILFVILYQRRIISHQLQLRELNRLKQKELMEATIRGEEEERTRIASELHDDVGATLSSVRLFLHQVVREPDNVALALQTKKILDEGIRKVRDLSHQLQPSSLQYVGLGSALQSMADTLSRSGVITIEYKDDNRLLLKTDSQTELAIYRIVQEFVSNIIKHADANLIRIGISGSHPPGIQISHNGRGLSQQEYAEQLYKKGAIGLKNIENRLKASNLTLDFLPPEAGIYAVNICLPPST